jgi:hypothetical protein
MSLRTIEVLAREDGAEYLIHLDGAPAPFATGGFETALSLKRTLSRGETINGAFYDDERNREWTLTNLNTNAIIAITDLRGD